MIVYYAYQQMHKYIYIYIIFYGARGGVVAEALRYEPVGRGFDSRWCHWNFSVTLALESTQPPKK
jgi:hypothetical protein